ncbi:uncharacterized protein BO80DRAFT_147772 [Aspergillus ibericus CBS 121593]|uniref:Uncharacterized protein n=1 Tax=Aspergillus ibericus CBS 121593 TaxID=1448316 RepID=A0A395GTX5_9EURO|nr:hypothetical protein BO80DRAFT_147772 [Aspergillus ibericus CBS 121593]RAK98862.1 hypothetical protein BO80DRAFT_147772 [Aspergillus ibericus CBS 121593]
MIWTVVCLRDFGDTPSAIHSVVQMLFQLIILIYGSLHLARIVTQAQRDQIIPQQ